MRILFNILLFGYFLGQTAFAQQNSAIDSLFRDWNTPKTPGGVVAVLQEDQVVYKKAFGIADIQKGVSNTIDLSFNLASVAKQFTATCIALLEEQDKLSLEDHLSQYYPEFPFADSVKIKHLLDHTSGIREASVLAILSGKMNIKGQLPRKYQTKDYYFKMLSKQTNLNYPPGEMLAYTNINYILLGDIVEKVSGQSLRQFADSAIFQPLGMTNTFFRDSPDTVVSNEAKGYLYTGKKYKRRKVLGGIVGDHNLVSTLDNLIAWMRNFNHNQLGYKNDQLIKTLTTSSHFNNGKLTSYAYGLWTSEYRGLHQVYHGGDNGQHTSFIVRFPEQKLSVIVLANSSKYDDTQSKAYQIADILLKGKLKEKTEIDTSFTFISLKEEALRPKVGLYKMINDQGMGQIRKVSLNEGSLYISDNYHHDGLKLDPIATDEFIAKNPIGKYLHITFTGTPEGIQLLEQYEGKERELSKVKELIVNYDNYRGFFTNKSVNVNLNIKSKRDRIFAKKGIIKIPLVPIDKDTFFDTNNNALFVFKRNGTGQVVQLKVNANDFRNFIFEKSGL